MNVSLEARTLPRLGIDEIASLKELQPGARGFWTDEELLRDAELSSLPMLKKLQAMGWVHPSYFPIDGGGRRRGWVFRDVMRVALIAELARRTDLAVLAVATLLVRAPFEWLESAAELDRRTASALGVPVQAKASDRYGTRICILDMTEAWIERTPGEFELISDGLVLSGAKLAAPAFRETRRPRREEPELVAGRAVVLMLDLASLPLSVVGVVAETQRMLGRQARSR